jgi:predicted nuclease with TOPRIM domain
VANTTNNQSTTDAPKKKLTVSFLNETKADKESTAKGFADVHTRIDGVKAELAKLQYLVEQLQRRGQGTTLANARAATLESELGKITKRIDEITSKSSDELDPAALTAFQQEAQRLNGRLEDLFGRVSGDVNDLRERLDTLESRVDGHDTAIGAHDTEIGMLREGQQSLHGRVTIIERLRDTLPKWPLAIGIIAGVIGGIVWDAIPFSQSYPLADGTTKVVPLEAANTIWAALGAGFATFVVATAIALYFAKAKVAQETPQHAAPPVPTPPHAQIVHSAPVEPDAPTKVLETQGARPGTRD